MSAPTLARADAAPHQLPTEARISTLDQHTRDLITGLMEDADETDSITVRRALHKVVADLIGIQLPDRQELALCTCGACYCDRIFDAWLARIYLDGTVERAQCTGCADDHPQDGE